MPDALCVRARCRPQNARERGWRESGLRQAEIREASRSRIVDGNVLGFYDGASVSALRSIVSRKVRSTNTSGVTGVTVRRNAASITYKARIMVRGETINLGNFVTIEEAIEARKRAENAYFREIINNYEKREKRIENGLPESTEKNE